MFTPYLVIVVFILVNSVVFRKLHRHPFIFALSGCRSMTTEVSSEETGLVYIRISIPDKNIQKCLQFDLSGTVGQAKETILGILGSELHDSWNYGLFCPPTNGRAGKFLQEERPLKEYPLSGPIGFLEFKYKRRVYRSLAVNPSKLKKIQSKTNQKQFMDCVKLRDISKVTKWLNKGLDPNFHNKDTGETPLCLAVRVEKARELIMALVSGGAHLDFRARDTMAPLHKAAVHNNYDAIRTLLDLGQSPNCRDSKGLTPLYYSCYYETRALCAERLLYDHAVLGVTNEQGLCEIHQACRHGRVQHLEFLLTYGADINARTNNGNTPLHICSLAKQEACANVLLFRGADRKAINNTGQTAYQTALINGHKAVAELIKGYKDEDVVPLKSCSVKLNSHRREGSTSVRNPRSSSMNRLTDYADSGISEPSSPAASSARVSGTATMGRRFRRRGDLGVSGTTSRSVCNLTARHFSDEESALEGGVVFNWDSEYSGSDLCSSLASSMRSHFRPTSDGSDFGSLRLTDTRMRPSILPFICPETSTLPRTVVLQKGAKGFGFVLRGAKVANAVDFQPTSEVPALQYFERVEHGTPADKANIKAGDYLLEINGENVVSASHEHTVKLIRDAGNTVALKVISIDKHIPDQHRILETRMDMLRNKMLHYLRAESFAQILSEYECDRVSLRSCADSSASQMTTGSLFGADKTASIRSRASRTITESELEEIFARGGRQDLSSEEDGIATNGGSTGAAVNGGRPEIPQAPRLYSDEADIKVRLKANLNSNRTLSMVSSSSGSATAVGAPPVGGGTGGGGGGEHSSNASSADDSGVSVNSVPAADHGSVLSPGSGTGTLPRSKQPPPPPLRRASCGLSLSSSITTSSTSTSSNSSSSSASASTAKSVLRTSQPANLAHASSSNPASSTVTFADERSSETSTEQAQKDATSPLLPCSGTVLERLAKFEGGSREKLDVVESPVDSPPSHSSSDSRGSMRVESGGNTPGGSLPSSPPPPPPPPPISPPADGRKRNRSVGSSPARDLSRRAFTSRLIEFRRYSRCSSVTSSNHDEDIPLPPPPPPLQSSLPNVPSNRRIVPDCPTESSTARRPLIDMHEAKLRAAIAQRRSKLDLSPSAPLHQRTSSGITAGAVPLSLPSGRRNSLPDKPPLPPPPPHGKAAAKAALSAGRKPVRQTASENASPKTLSPDSPAAKTPVTPTRSSSSTSSTATPNDDLLDSICLPPPAGFADSPPQEEPAQSSSEGPKKVYIM